MNKLETEFKEYMTKQGIMCGDEAVKDTVKFIYRYHHETSLLDHFAGQALQGMLANGGIRGHMDGTGDAKDHAIWAYEYADEMLKISNIKSKEEI